LDVKIAMKSFAKTHSSKTVRMNISMERARPPRLATVMFDDLQIVIPFRNSKLTKAALEYAIELNDGQNVRVRLIDVHVVPYSVPLDQPTVNSKYLERRLKNVGRGSELPISAEVVYAHDWEQGFRRVLTRGSMVLLPMRRVWWRTSEKRFAARLRKLGHTVAWVECE
jgi:hypothetical protein